MNGMILQTVVELPEFIKQSSRCMTNESKADFIGFIAENPLVGDLIIGTGGARKVRWQSSINGGKRGGVRVIYYYHDQEMPIFLFTAYKKNQKENLTSFEKKMFKNIIDLIVETYEVSNE